MIASDLWILGLLSAIFAIAAALASYAFWIEPRRLVITKVTIPVRNLAEPVRMVVIADPQPAGPHETPERLNQIVERANALNGDIILLLGDYVTTRRLKTSFTDPRDTIAALSRLDAPMGVFAVLGNHDWWWNGDEMRRLISQTDIRLLEDDALVATGGGKRLWIAGLSDPVTQLYSIPKTLDKTDDTAPIILLTHTPDVFPDIPASVALTLAGHTHGGQVWLPLISRPIVPSRFGQRYAYGHVVEQGRQLFVSSGIGTSIIPIRFMTPPEIVVVTLVPW